MRKMTILLLVANMLALYSCNFSAGTNKNFGTGLSFNYNGFRVDNVLLVGPDNIAMQDNKVALNSKIAVDARGISNYGLKDRKVFPGMTLVITDKQDSVVSKSPDLFQGTDGLLPEVASVLRGTIIISAPMKAGETYHVRLYVWDKVKPGNEINAETDIIVMGDELK